MTRPLHHFCGTLIPLLALAPIMLLGQETTSPTVAAPAAPAAPIAPSTLVQPALTHVESTLNALKIDKWKKGSVRDEAGDNVNAILRDLKTNLPPLLADADSAPGALSKSIPLIKHLDALYDVVLRVEEGARVSAPTDQIDQLEAALKQFGGARIQLYDAMTERAAGQEKQVTDLQAAPHARLPSLRPVKSARRRKALNPHLVSRRRPRPNRRPNNCAHRQRL